jgi:hypothetical protein
VGVGVEVGVGVWVCGVVRVLSCLWDQWWHCMWSARSVQAPHASLAPGPLLLLAQD